MREILQQMLNYIDPFLRQTRASARELVLPLLVLYHNPRDRRYHEKKMQQKNDQLGSLLIKQLTQTQRTTMLMAADFGPNLGAATGSNSMRTSSDSSMG